MTSKGSGAPPPADEAKAAFDPWAPRAAAAAKRPSTLPGAPGSPPTVTGNSRVQLGGRAPVADEARPPGAPPAPPTGWPTPRLPADLVPGTSAPRRSAALIGFCAFLLGAVLVGSAFAAYAAGNRNGSGSKSSSTSTTRPPTGSKGALDIQRILDVARPSVVTIETGTPNSVFGGAGSGVVISADGLILTNAHVIEGAGGNISVRFSDGTTAEAQLVGASTGNDIALIRAARQELTPATLGSSANLLVGDPVVAIGNALNLGGDPSVTSGIVSAKDRAINDGSIKLDHLIQTDAAINPGNSGGPLVDAGGQVVGINTAIIQGAQNIGFSIAIDSVKDLIDQLKQGGGDLTPKTAVLGVSAIDVSSPSLDQSVKDQYGITAKAGALVVAVDPNGGAAKSGLAEGDVVTEVEGDPIKTSAELTKAVREHQPGDDITVTTERRGKRRILTVTLGP